MAYTPSEELRLLTGRLKTWRAVVGRLALYTKPFLEQSLEWIEGRPEKGRHDHLRGRPKGEVMVVEREGVKRRGWIPSCLGGGVDRIWRLIRGESESRRNYSFSFQNKGEAGIPRAPQRPNQPKA